MSRPPMDVPEFLRELPIGAVFSHARPDEQPDSWLQVGDDAYRRTYSWVRFPANDFSSWTHVELTKPVGHSLTQEEVDALERRIRKNPGPREMGG